MSLFKSSAQSSRETYERWSDFYDHFGPFNNYLEKWDREILTLAPAAPLLDIGCGPGRLLNKLLRAGFRDLAGVDIAKAGLLLARQKASPEFADNVLALAESAAERLPFRDLSFQSIIISGALHHLEKPEIVLAECARVLDISGRLIIADPYFPPPMRQFINLMLSVYPITGDRRFYTASRVTSLASKAGFAKKKMINMPLAYILVFEKCSSSE